jgi:hypothetical protein
MRKFRVVKDGFSGNNGNEDFKTLTHELQEIHSQFSEEELNTEVRTVLVMVMNKDESMRFIPNEGAMFRDTLYMCDDVRSEAWNLFHNSPQD